MRNHLRNGRLQETGCGVITNLSTIKANAQELLNLGAGECVVQSAKTHAMDEAVQAKAVCALRNLSWWSETDVMLLVELGALKAVHKAMKHFPGNLIIQEKGTETVSKLSSVLDVSL